jgi:hypothetical protein
MVQELIYGMMAENTMDSGRTMIWRALVSTYGLTVVVMKDNITMIKRVVSVFIIGPMVESMKDGGTKENSMV